MSIATTSPGTISTGARAREWWTDHFAPAGGEGPRTPDSAARARLRRAGSAADAAAISAAVDLARRLGTLAREARGSDWRAEAALNLARVLAHVREDDHARRPMQAAGWQTFPGNRRESEAGDQRPVLSEARFRRLLQTGTREEQVSAFARLVTLLGGSVNVAELATDFMRWSDDSQRDRVRTRWAFDYFHAWGSAPSIPLNATEDDAT